MLYNTVCSDCRLQAAVFCYNMLILDQKLRVTSDLKAYSQFTFYLVNTALIQASMAEKEEMLQYEDEFVSPHGNMMRLYKYKVDGQSVSFTENL